MTITAMREKPLEASNPPGRPALTKAIGVAFALGATHVLAQNAAVPPADPSAPATPKKAGKEEAQVLEKVNVYGDEPELGSPKFTAPLIDTPMSITILPQSVIRETAATSLQDALRNVPGITFAAGEGGTPTGDLPSIRGFNSSSNVYVDGMRDIGVQTRDVFDLEQIEVVKGPDSSIAGRSAGGGSLNLVSKTAGGEDFVELAGTYGSAGQFRASADANVKISDTIAARINVMGMGGGVPGRDSAVRSDKLGVAPTITFGLSTATRLTLSYYHFEDKSTPDYGVPVDYFSTGRPLPETEGISRENFYGLSDRDFRRAPVDSGTVRIEHDFNDAFTLRSQVRYTVSENDYVLTLPYLATTADYEREPGLVYRLPIGNADRTRGLVSQTDLFGHFDTGPIRHDVDVGFEISEEKERLAGGGSWLGYDVVSSAGPQGFNGGDCLDPALLASYDCTSLNGPNPRDPWKGTLALNTGETAYFTTHDLAPYAFDTIALTPHWKINAGLRWEKYRTGARDPANPGNWGGSDDISFTSYQVSLMYKPVEQGTIYVTTSSAAIPADLANSGAGQDQAYPAGPGYPGTLGLKPEKTRTLELGTKWNLFGNRLLVSGGIFDEKHTDALVELAPDVNAQVGETRVKGVELSVNGTITERWNIIAGYSYLDAKIVTGSDYNALGQQLPNTPPHTFSLWSTYRVIPAVTVGGGAYYRDKQVGYGGYIGSPNEYIDGYTRVDAMAKWQVDPRLGLQLNVQNLFDTDYYSKTFYWYALPAAGRSWMLTVDLKL